VESGVERAGDLVANPKNWREHPKAQQAGMEAVLDEVGWVQDVIVNRRTGRLVDGHLRVELARAQGEDTPVPVKYVELSEDEERVILATLDPLGAMAVTDVGTLAEVVQSIDGLAVGQLQNLIEGIAQDAGIRPDGNRAEDPGPQIDKADELQEKWQVASGDVWQCGDSLWLICGDCREPKTWDRALNIARIQKVNGVFTSPPYAEQRKQQYGGVPVDEYVGWWEAVQENVRAHLADDGSFFINIKPHCERGERVLYVMDLVIAMKRQWGWRFVDELIWRKMGLPGGWNNRFRNDFESVFMFTRDTPAIIYLQVIEELGDIEGSPFIDEAEGIYHFSPRRKIKFHPKAMGTPSDRIRVYRPTNLSQNPQTGNITVSGPMRKGLARPGNVITINVNGAAYAHSAVFPVDLPRFFICSFSDIRDVWCDPFGGSGTTGVAAYQSGRAFLGIEILDKHCAVTLERWRGLTGLEPRLVEG